MFPKLAIWKSPFTLMMGVVSPSGVVVKKPSLDVKLTNFSVQKKKSAIQEIVPYPKIAPICSRMSFIKDVRYFAMKVTGHSWKQESGKCSNQGMMAQDTGKIGQNRRRPGLLMRNGDLRSSPA